VHTALSVNAEMVLLYCWSIVRAILERQQPEGCGASVIDQLVDDLHHEFPNMAGSRLET
jgi:hypothetical protein